MQKKQGSTKSVCLLPFEDSSHHTRRHFSLRYFEGHQTAYQENPHVSRFMSAATTKVSSEASELSSDPGPRSDLGHDLAAASLDSSLVATLR